LPSGSSEVDELEETAVDGCADLIEMELQTGAVISDAPALVWAQRLLVDCVGEAALRREQAADAVFLAVEGMEIAA